MSQITPGIRLLTLESQESGLHIRTLILEYNGNIYHLSGGTGDLIHVFTQGVCIYVLTINKALGYVGLNAYMTPEPDPINSLFLQSTRDISDSLGHKWQQLSPKTIVAKLISEGTIPRSLLRCEHQNTYSDTPLLAAG
jgi:hypothetical protein